MTDQLSWIVATLLFALILYLHDARAAEPVPEDQQRASGQAIRQLPLAPILFDRAQTALTAAC